MRLEIGQETEYGALPLLYAYEMVLIRCPVLFRFETFYVALSSLLLKFNFIYLADIILSW